MPIELFAVAPNQSDDRLPGPRAAVFGRGLRAPLGSEPVQGLPVSIGQYQPWHEVTGEDQPPSRRIVSSHGIRPGDTR